MRSEHEKQKEDEAACDCTREDCGRRRAHAKVLQQTIVDLMCKQRDRTLEEQADASRLSSSITSPAFKDRLDTLISRVSRLDDSRGSVRSEEIQAELHEWQERVPISGSSRLQVKDKEMVFKLAAAEADRESLQATCSKLHASLNVARNRCADLEEELLQKDNEIFGEREARIAAEEEKNAVLAESTAGMCNLCWTNSACARKMHASFSSDRACRPRPGSRSPARTG
jgi:hypothetical protein